MEKITTTLTFIRRNKGKFLLSVICVLACGCHIGFSAGSSLLVHIMAQFCHANIFHLAVNLMVLWNIRGRISYGLSMLVAVVSSFLPMFVFGPTMGLSGFLFAAFGIMWGRSRLVWKAYVKAGPLILITMLIPNVNGIFHLYAFSIGILVGFWRFSFRSY